MRAGYVLYRALVVSNVIQIFSALTIVCGAVTLSRMRERLFSCSNRDDVDRYRPSETTTKYNPLLICSALLLAICGVVLLLETILLIVSFVLKCNKIFTIVVSYMCTHRSNLYIYMHLYQDPNLFFFKATRTLSRKKIAQKPPHNRAGCIVEPYNASRQPKFQFCQKLVKVVTFMFARGPAPHVARGRKHCKRMASLYKHMGKLQRAVTLILRHESKFLKV